MVSSNERDRKVLEECVSNIETGCFDGAAIEFISVDMEMSGLTSERHRAAHNMTFEEFYKIHKDGANNFGVMQLGICLAGRGKTSKKTDWHVRPYNFYVFPSRRRIVMTDTHSLKFLLKSKFDFEKWIRHGYDYESLNDIEHERRQNLKTLNERIEAEGVQRIIKAMIETDNPVPLVVHNGLLDLLHLLDKFIMSVRTQCRTAEAFAKHVTNFWPAGILDTKYIAKNSQFYSLLQMGSTGLLDLRDALYQMNGSTSPAIITGDLRERYKRKDAAHEAGFDAMVTAEVLILELIAVNHFAVSCFGYPAGNQFCYQCDCGSVCAHWREMLEQHNVANKIDLCVRPNVFDLNNPYAD